MLYLTDISYTVGRRTQVLVNSAEGYAALGLHREAWAALERIPPEERILPRCMILNVDLLLHRRYWKQAERLCRNALRTFPHMLELKAMMAFIYLARGRQAKCNDTLKQIEETSSRALVIYNVGCLAAKFGYSEVAKDSIEKATQLNSSLRSRIKVDEDLVLLHKKSR